MQVALLSLLLLATSGTGRECSSCTQDYCRNVTADQSDGCYNAVLPQSNSCNCNSSVLECNGANANILPEFVDCEVEGFNMSQSETSTLDPIGSGFYFIRGYQFCTSKCFNKIFLLAEINQTLAGSRDILRFHIYKRYTNTADFPSSFFVEQYNFSVMLTPVKESNYTVEAMVTDPMACFESNDYLGFSVGEGLTIETSGITGRGLRHGLQIYDHIPLISNCGSNSIILNLPFGNRVQSSLPVMALSYKDTPNMPTEMFTATSSSPSFGEFSTSSAELTSTSSSELTSTNASAEETPAVSPTNSLATVIGVSITAGFVVGLIPLAILVIVMFLVCRRKKSTTPSEMRTSNMEEDEVELSSSHIVTSNNEAYSSVRNDGAEYEDIPCSSDTQRGDLLTTKSNEAYFSSGVELIPTTANQAYVSNTADPVHGECTDPMYGECDNSQI